MERRLFIVSNRLPVNIETHEDKTTVRPSPGGLVTAIDSYMQKKELANEKEFDKKLWVGVPGCTYSNWSRIAGDLSHEQYEYLPVFIPKKTFEGYYNGMANSVLWALFHYFPSFAEFNSNNYQHYHTANNEFLSVLMRHLRPHDTVWIHDYHLLPLAGMLREQMPELTIGFFLHIPFPSYEIFRIMPKRWQRDLLKGMLGADLVGFHTRDYADHFLKCVQKVLGIDHYMNVLRLPERLIQVGVYPISIDYEKFHNAWDDKIVKKLREQMKSQFPDKKIIFSADRLDYTKGVTNRLRGYEYFLNKYPEYREQVVFVMVIVPSRDALSKYAERKKMIDEFIGSLNSTLGNFSWQPVIYQYNALNFEELVAMYTSCDLALITPIRDGMNLVAKEFVASRKDEHGVLVLSEMTGAAKELTEALNINPIDIEEIAEKIKRGLEMSPTEQKARIRKMQQRISRYDVTRWAEEFFNDLNETKTMKQNFQVRFLDSTEKTQLIYDYAKARTRLLLLDYDGTLSPIVSLPQLAQPTDELLDTLRLLSSDERNDVYIISGRDATSLNEWLGDLPVNIIAEHGSLVKMKNGTWMQAPHAAADWQPLVVGMMERYVANCPGSFIERKRFALAWHYRNADAETAPGYAMDLYEELNGSADKVNVNVIRGNKVIEVRSTGIDKGKAAQNILQNKDYDFIFACGDDTTDEDMFRQLAGVKNSYTIKVGTEASYARYNLHTSEMVLPLLQNFGHSGTKKAELSS